MLNGNSGIGSNSNSVTGVPDPIGLKWGEPHPWVPFQVIR